MRVPDQNQSYTTSESVDFFTNQSISFIKPLIHSVSYALMNKLGKDKAKEMTSKYFGKESAEKLASDKGFLLIFLNEIGVKNICFDVVVRTSDYTFDYSGLKVEL